MNIHPCRFAQAGKASLRGRICAAVFKSPYGQRVLRECQETLNKSANVDEYSQRLVIRRYAMELDLLPDELKDLLKRNRRDLLEPRNEKKD